MKYAVSEQQGAYHISFFIYTLSYHHVKVLEKLHVFRVLDHVELVALMRQLPSILKEHPRVKYLAGMNCSWRNILTNKKPVGEIGCS